MKKLVNYSKIHLTFLLLGMVLIFTACSKKVDNPQAGVKVTVRITEVPFPYSETVTPLHSVHKTAKIVFLGREQFISDVHQLINTTWEAFSQKYPYRSRKCSVLIYSKQTNLTPDDFKEYQITFIRP